MIGLLGLLAGCVVDLPSFQGSPTSPTGETADDTSAPHTGDTSTASVATGDTADTPQHTAVPAPTCAFGEIASRNPTTLIPGLAIDTFQLYGTAAPMRGVGPGGTDGIWYTDDDLSLRVRSFDGTNSQDTSQTAFPGPINSLRVGHTATGAYLIAQTGQRTLHVLDEAGNAEAMVTVDSECDAPFFGVAVAESFDFAPGDDLVHTCIDTGNFGSLWAAKLTDPGGGSVPSVPVVRFDRAQETGFFGRGLRSLTPRPSTTEPTELWVGDQTDGTEAHRVHLMSGGTPYIDGPNQVRLTITGDVYAANSAGPSPVPVAADFDGDGADDVAIAMPGSAMGGGELWVHFNIPATQNKSTLGRDDMDLRITSGASFDRIDGVAALPQPDGFVALAISGRSDTGAPAVALIPRLPRPGSSQQLYTVADLAVATLEQPPEHQPFIWDLLPAGDIDADGCNDLLVHIANETLEYYGTYPTQPYYGRGTAYVLSGR